LQLVEADHKSRGEVASRATDEDSGSTIERDFAADSPQMQQTAIGRSILDCGARRHSGGRRITAISLDSRGLRRVLMSGSAWLRKEQRP
jgi:hypothetical protein